jgi:dienelactone hydrolase
VITRPARCRRVAERRRARKRIPVWGLGLALAGCATGVIAIPYLPDRGGSAPTRTSVDPFPYTRGRLDAANHLLAEEETNDYVVRFLSWPSIGENGLPGNVIAARYYQRKAPGPQSLIVVLPIWGGHPYPSSIVTRDLTNAGWGNVMHVLGEHMIIDWGALENAPTVSRFTRTMQRMVDRMRVTVIDLRRLMDWAETRPEIDARRIGLVGFSESTLQVAGVLASDDRPAAAVLVMGGAHPHAMLGTCYGPPADVRKAVLPRFGWTVAQYVDTLDLLMAPIDPARLGSRVDPARVLVVDAHDDDCIPQSARDALWWALGRPERITVRAGHAGSFLAMTFLGGNHVRKSIARFLARTLAPPAR